MQSSASNPRGTQRTEGGDEAESHELPDATGPMQARSPRAVECEAEAGMAATNASQASQTATIAHDDRGGKSLTGPHECRCISALRFSALRGIPTTRSAVSQILRSAVGRKSHKSASVLDTA